jgi:hypothetical protein
MVTRRRCAVKARRVIGLRSAPTLTRSAWALLFAFVVALRLLTPAGFMPAFERGAVIVVVCPDDSLAVPAIAHHHHGGGQKTVHQPCPYAAGAASGLVGGEVALFAVVLLFGAVLLVGRAFGFLERRRSHERPPLRGPPLPA